MIFDGYNMDGVARDGDVTLRFLYRPMLSAERREFLKAFRGWPRDTSIREKSEWLQQHVLAMAPYESVIDVQDRPKLFRKLHHILVGVAGPENQPEWSRYWESLDVQNLRSGIRLAVLNPLLAARSCADCQKWWYREDDGTIEKEDGRKALRPVEFPPMCRTRDGCPVGTPENSRRLTPRNVMAWQHFQRCEAIGKWPDDAIVARNALVIRRARDDAQRERTGYGSGGGRGHGNVARNGGDSTVTYVPADANPFFFAGRDIPV